MKVKNMKSSNGNAVANQFIISEYGHDQDSNKHLNTEYFQSYDSTIATKSYGMGGCRYAKPVIYLDFKYWNYSVTTGKYRNQFLGETKAETQKKIDSGEYKLVDLN